MRIDVLTLFPEVFAPFLRASIPGRASSAGLVRFELTNFRDFASDRHRSVDDKPFGGGPGMVLRCEPIFRAVEHATTLDKAEPTIVLLSPQGESLTQPVVEELAEADRLMLICGHYEGFDERIRTGLGAREISIGDYVLSGGEAAAMVVIDSVVRLLPGALGDPESTREESFADGLLEYPQYTRPREFAGMPVPEVLISGHHEAIRQWRRTEALKRTRVRRPDLLSSGGAGGSGPLD